MSGPRTRISLGPTSQRSPPPFSDARSWTNNCVAEDYIGSGDEKEKMKMDRRAMVDEWRRTRGVSGVCAQSATLSTMKSSVSIAVGGLFMNEEGTLESDLLGPALGLSSVNDDLVHEGVEDSGLSALQRYRLRRKLRGNATAGQQPALSNPRPEVSSAAWGSKTIVGLKPPPHAEDDELQPPGTPGRMSNRVYSSALSQGGAHRRVRRRTSLSPSVAQLLCQQGEELRKSRPILPPAYPASHFAERLHEKSEADVVMPQRQVQPSTYDCEECELEEHQQKRLHHQSTSDLSPVESVDSAALRSRLYAMQRRIEKIEREKMELSISKAPLEARMRQKEDAWARERERLFAEIEEHQRSNMEADERYREMEMRAEALTEVNAKLIREARAGGNGSAGCVSGTEGGPKDSWSERLKTSNEIKDLRQELKNKDDEIKSLRITKVSLESDVFGCHTKIKTLTRNYDELERDYRELELSKSQNTEAEIQLQVLTTEHTAMTAQLNATCADLEEMKVRAKADLQDKEESWRACETRLLFDMSVLKSRAGKSSDEDEDGDSSDTDPAILKARIEERDRRIAELEEKLLSGEQIRRALHNRIQELRGNIRVYVRTRPFLPTDGVVARHSSIDILPDGESLTILGKHLGEGHAFKFDKVFAPSTGQDMVFDEVSEFVQSALDGYHVCLFSYGQTGSGKTHTMQGSGNGAMRGIIPRAVEQILSQAAVMQSQRWTFTMKASFLEIYNEDLRDLLVNLSADRSIKAREARTVPKLSIKRNVEGKSFVDGINKIDIDVANRAAGMAQLDAIISAAARARSVATTKMNAQSSRSHSVFMLQLCGSNEESGTTVQGALNLCDLAGSERLDRSGAASDAQRLKETQAINKSLSCLGDVFTSLTNGSKHVPFRNSKLTYLLQDCLSGDGKALMFVNLSPTLESSNESLCSLRFAQRVNQVELGRATKDVQYGCGKGSSTVKPASR